MPMCRHCRYDKSGNFVGCSSYPKGGKDAPCDGVAELPEKGWRRPLMSFTPDPPDGLRGMVILSGSTWYACTYITCNAVEGSASRRMFNSIFNVYNVEDKF